jgi:hypothetical protein
MMKTLIMKSKFFYFALLLLAGMVGCQNQSVDDNPNTTGTSTTISGKWKITLYKEDNKDETNHFTGYTFDFNTDGTVVATKGSISVTGKHYDGVDDSKVKYILDFGSTSPLDELNEDWEIIEQSATKLHLYHKSGGNGGTDDLIFEK